MKKSILFCGVFIICAIMGHWIAASAYGWPLDREITAAEIVGFLGVLATFYRVSQTPKGPTATS